MQIQINTDHTIAAHEKMTTHVRDTIESALSRISEHITRVEVHLSDENGGKNGRDDKRCVLEARREGEQPVAVTFRAATVDQSVDGAVEKLIRMIENTVDRHRDQERHKTE